MSKKTREVTKKEIITMLSQIEKKDNIAIFNAQKAVYIYVDEDELTNQIIEFLNKKLEKLNG